MARDQLRINETQREATLKGGQQAGRQKRIDIEITARWDEDTKRMHRFIIDDGQVVTGSLYVPKGSVVPEVVTIRLRTKRDEPRGLMVRLNE